MTDHGPQQGQGADAEAILTAHQRHRGGCLCGWSELGKSHPGHQVAMLREALQGDEGRRAAQIRAVRDVLGWPTEADPELDLTLDDEAGRLVDAVNAAGGPDIEQIGPPSFVLTPKLTEQEAEDFKRRFVETMRTGRITVLPEPTPDQLDQARAAGYRDAVTALRDDARFLTWWKSLADPGRYGMNTHEILADYLEAVGPGAQKPQDGSGEAETALHGESSGR